MTWWRSLRPGTRRVLAVLAVLLGVNAGFAALESVVGGSGPGGPAGSSYATAPAGLSAFADLLVRHGHPVERLRTRIDEAETGELDTVVVADVADLAPAEIDALARLVSRGGRVIVAGPVAARVVARFTSPPSWSARGTDRAVVLAPVPETAGITRVRDDGAGSWDEAGGLLPVVGTRGAVVAAAGAVGDGRLVALADAGVLSNAHLGEDDNAAFALALAGPRGGRVTFAESGHGYGESTGLSAVPDRWIWALALVAAAALVWMWARGRRLGPPEDVERALPPPRRAYVDALATSLARTRDPAAAAEPLQDAARRALRRRAGLGPDADDADVAAAARRLGVDESIVAVVTRPAASDDDLVAAARAVAVLEGGGEP